MVVEERIARKRRLRAEQQKRYDLSHPGVRQAAYEQRVRDGYYHDACPICGATKTRVSKTCQPCSVKGRVTVERPLELPCQRAVQCILKEPHDHCPNCWLPVRPAAGWCAMCRAEAERGACMTERESSAHEEAA